MKPFTIAALFFILCSYAFAADENDWYQEIEIKFSKSSLTVKQALDEISKLPDVDVVYNGKESYLKVRLTLPIQPISVQQALDLIRKQAPVDFIFSNNHIVVKSRKLADNYKLSGQIKDSETNENLVGVNIFLRGTYKGTVTDANGKFSLHLNPGQYIVVCKYIGYKLEEIAINLYNNINLNINLEVTRQEIEAVNIIGRKREVETLQTGRTIETIESKTIEQLSTNDLNDALHGRVSGVWVTKVSGAPGDHHKIRIRGISSIFGSTDPLYVVDGTVIPVVDFKSLGIADLNIHDVDNMTILKDASSTALYGYLGGNGVILIETKKGGGETKFNAGFKKGYQQFTKRYDLMNSEDFYNTLEFSSKVLATHFYSRYFPEDNQYPYYRDSLGNTLGYDDFQEKIFNTGEINEYQLSGHGNFKTIDFYISGNYYSHKGVVINSSYNKYTFTGNFSKIIKDKFSVRLLYKGSHQENSNNIDNYMGNNLIIKGINCEPAYYTTPDSYFRKGPGLYYWGNSPIISSLSERYLSPDTLFNCTEKKKMENSHSINAQGFFRINKVFSLQTNHSFTLKNFIYSSFLPGYSYQGERYLSSNENIYIINQQYDLNFDKELKNHKINSFVRFRNYNDNIYWNIDSSKNINRNGVSIENDIYIRGSQSIYGENGSVRRSINSLIAGFSYNYKSKYFISIIVNKDNLKEGIYVDRKDIFSSITLDWDLAKEQLFRFPVWIDAFHIYANRGQSGNYPLNSLSNDLFHVESYAANNTFSKSVELSNLANHNIKHEKITESNFGTKAHLFKNRIEFSVDYYIKYNSNLIIKRTIPRYYGGGFFYQNIGKMANKGLELSLVIVPFNRPNLYWSTRFGYAFHNQVIMELYDGTPISFNNTDILYPDFYAMENRMLGEIIGYDYQGKWIDSLHARKPMRYPQYFDASDAAYSLGDTLIHFDYLEIDDHKVVIGNSIPKITFNWINEIIYKNFSCEMLWYGVIGADKYNGTKASTYISGLNTGVKEIVSDTLRYLKTGIFYQSSFFVEDASFIRLKTLRFSYKQPKKIASRIGLTYTVSFENLITLTKYSGYDPEATTYTNNNFTDNAMDRGAYPNPRGYFFSINVSF